MHHAWRTVRVFISSTFRDLHAERDHLIKVVFPKLRQWCEPRRLHLVDIDLRWGVTEAEANNGKALDICLKEIDSSQFFVCLLGERYGFVPEQLPEEDLYRFTESHRNKSITHLEIMHAFQKPLERLKPLVGRVRPQAFFYFRRSSCLPSPESLAKQFSRPEFEQYQKAFFEPPPRSGELDRRDHLRQLKAEIPKESVFEYQAEFDPTADNPEDDQGLKGRFTKLEDLGNRIEADLMQSIEAQFSEHIRASRQPVDPLVEERALHEAFIENRTQVHVPRVEVEQHLTAYLHSDDHCPLVLSGPPGSGKSAILAHWVKEIVDPATWLAKWDRTTLVIPRFIGASPSSTSLPRLLGGICQELVQHFALQEEVEVEGPGGTKTKHTQAMEVPQDPALLQATWPKFLEAATAKGKVLLVLDAVNQLDRSADPLRLYWLPYKLPAGLRIIVSVLDHGERSRPESLDRKPPVGMRGEPPDWLAVLRRREVREVPVDELSEDQQLAIIRQLPSVFSKNLDPKYVRVLAENWAMTNPLFLIVALEELRVFGGIKRLEEKIANLPQLAKSEPDQTSSRTIDDTLDELFGQILDRLDREATKRGVPKLVPTLFRLLATAKEGLSERELQELLALLLPNADGKLREGETQVVLRQVRNYLMRKGPLLDFYHRSFWKAVRTKYLAASADRYTAHRDVADYFADERLQPFWLPDQQTAKRQVSAGPYDAVPNERKVVELPWQRVQMVREAREGNLAGELPGACVHLEGLFEDIFFLEAKAQAGQVFELATEFTQTVQTLPDDRPQRRILKLIEEALRRDIHFIARHPTTVFQCLWNSCWWFDCSKAAMHYDPPASGWPPEGPPWQRPGAKLSALLESWHTAKRRTQPAFVWLRSLRPSGVPLGAAQQRIFRGHEQGVTSVDYSPDGRQIVSGGMDQTVRVWDATTGEQLACCRAHQKEVSGVAFSPDGQRIISGSTDGTIRVWDAVAGTELQLLHGHEAGVKSVAFSPDGKHIASTSSDKTVRTWKVESGVEELCLKGMNSVAYSPDGQAIVTIGSSGMTLSVLDSVSGIERHCLGGHTRSVTQAAFSPDGRRIVSVSLDRTIRVWDGLLGVEQMCFLGQDDGHVVSVAFSPEGQCLVTGSGGWLNDHSVRVWSANTGAELQRFCGHENDVASVAFSPDGLQVVSASWDGTLRVWSLDDNAFPGVLRGHQPWGDVWTIKVSSDGRRIVSGSKVDGTARLWDSESGVELLCIDKHQSIDWPSIAVAFSPDGRRMVSTGDDTVRVWDAETGFEQLCLRGHKGYVGSVCYSVDGQRLVTGGEYDKTVRVWDAVRGAELHCLRGHEDSVWSVALSPDGRRVASGSDDRTVRVWDASNGSEFACLRGHAARVNCVAFSPDGRQIVSGSLDQTVRVWDVQSGAELAVLRRLAASPTNETTVERLSYSPDGRRIASESRDKTVRVWDAESFACLEVIPGTGDVAPIAAGARLFPWRAIARDLETVIEDAATGKVLAWFPHALELIITHPSSRQWAGPAGNHVYLIALEGYTSSTS